MPAALRLPNFMMPPLMSNHGNFIVSLGNVCRWLATKAEALGVEIYPGFAATEVLFDGRRGGRRRHRRHGDRQGRQAAQRLHPRHGASRQIHVVRRGRARQPVEDADREISASTRAAQPQKFGLGLKELWQVAPDKHKPGLVQHSFGWPLDNGTGGGSFLYHFDDNLVSVGFVVHLNYSNPYLSPFEEFQRFKTHPAIRGTFEGGKRLSYGARAITEGGYQSVPKLTFPGGALIGCAAGFINLPRIKGSHNAILSGMLAAEHAAEALAEGRANDELAGYDAGMARRRDRPRPVEGAQRQAAVVEARHFFGHRRRRLRHVVQHARLLAARHARSRQGRCRDAEAGGAVPARSTIRSRTASSPSTGCRRCSSPTPTTRKTSRRT